MKMSFEEFDAAGDRFVEDPDNNPLPIPCKTEDCDGEMLEYDDWTETYTCPICGRKVKKKNVMKYLKSMMD